MTRAAVVRALLGLALLAAGCTIRSRTPYPRTDQGEWAEKRDQATRRDLLYDGLDHRATATATHLSLPVREARARRLAEWKGWTAEELEQRLARERAEAAAGEEFLLVFYTPSSRANDLDAPRSIWHVAVKSEAGELVSVGAHIADADDELHGLFPWVGPFDTVYRVQFPVPKEGPLADEGYVLEIASALGVLELDYTSPPLPTPLIQPSPPEGR
ncbi:MULTISPECIES: hypothetical protein [Anaeromyxobacter]|uniref:hypothetical protein n=1 Tax=Anaeromyxobacter TaxID=161492 RepID=UPI001F5A4673|nr:MULTISPECIES: hypothetical protein [unclassified Anaeromyxobacter]